MLTSASTSESSVSTPARRPTTASALWKQAAYPAANSCSGFVAPPGPPISFGGFRCTSSRPSSVTACPDRPPVAVALAV
jgi:hypothetical protein